MFKFINRKRFLKSLKPGQIIRHQGTISNIIILFEFGHYDDSKDRIYWQTARVELGRRPEDDVITNTASVQFDGKLFEQIADIYKNGFSLASKQEIKRFEDAYDNMLKTIRAYYPEAVVVCGTLMRTKMKGRADWRFPEQFAGVGLEEYNDVIRRISLKNRCYLADIALSGEYYETLDGSHPTAAGHAVIANAWIRCLDSLGVF